MKTNIKRFRVFDIENQTLSSKCDTIAECVNKLQKLWLQFKADPANGGNPYLDFMIDDVHDDIEVNWVDLMEAWDNGERPEDLQMF